ncbi:MAG: type IV pili methyl-accepting chemotaxis transducer N-terminal domain-containing protein [Pseudomonadota bacterium]
MKLALTLSLTIAPMLASPTALARDVISAEFTDIAKIEIVSDSSDRIDIADQLPMLGQRVAASACVLTSGIEEEKSLAILETSYQQFERITTALRDGDADLNIPEPETRRITLHDIDQVWAQWGTTHDAVLEILADKHDIDAAHVIDDHNLKVLEATTVLAGDIAAQYTHPYEITQDNALLISLAGRQRTLTQKMIKDACEIWTHYHEEEGREDLKKTMEIFENSMLALRDGMPALGIKKAPTPEIRADLDAILDRWQGIKHNQQRLIYGEEIAPEDKSEIFVDLNLELAELNQLVAHYTAYATKHH